jgi:hypothetical protein
MQDQLVECKRCKGNACYEQHIDKDTTTWLCLGCGFTTSTLMTEGGKVTADLIETSPELYRDLLFTDEDKRVWAPATITLPGSGMVFLDGSSKEEWKWSAVKAIRITPEERTTKSFPKDQTHKMDMPEAKFFEQNEFMDALEVINFYDIK